MLMYQNGMLVVTNEQALREKLNAYKDFHFKQFNQEQKELAIEYAKKFKKLTFRRVIGKLKVIYWSKFGPSESESQRFTQYLKNLQLNQI